jgi:RNA polymerase sigma-70 factor (ECF subfamily)
MQATWSHGDPSRTPDLGRPHQELHESFARPMIGDDGAHPLPTCPSLAEAAPPSTPLSPAASARFRAMVDAHFNFVWRYLRGLGVPSPAVDDATQQVFVVAMSKIDMIEAGLERGFLVGTAHGIAANARRAEGRRREVHSEGELDGHVDSAPDPEQTAESKEAAVILDRFLLGLPEDLRAVFILFELEGMTMASISETLGIPPGTVASRLRRGREEFHEMAKRVQAGRSRGPLSGGRRS